MYEDRGLRVFSLEERYVAIGGANFRLESPQRVTSARFDLAGHGPRN